MTKSKLFMLIQGVADASIYKSIKKTEDFNDRTYILVRSALDKGWRNPNEVVGGVHDNGNGIRILISGKSLEIDYAETQELFLILREYLRDQTPTDIREIGKKEKL